MPHPGGTGNRATGPAAGPERRRGRRRAARAGAALLLLLLGACAPGARLGPDLGAYEIAESPAVAAAPWPKLVDVPVPPPPGTFTAAVPDPAEGEAIAVGLRAEAARLRQRMDALAGPVLTAEERARLARGVVAR